MKMQLVGISDRFVRRVKSSTATQFRIWAAERLKERIAARKAANAARAAAKAAKESRPMSAKKRRHLEDKAK